MADVSGYLILVEFGGIIRSVEFSRFLRCGVDISRNFRLMDFSKFLRFQFKVRIVCYRTFLLVIRGGK